MSRRLGSCWKRWKRESDAEFRGSCEADWMDVEPSWLSEAVRKYGGTVQALSTILAEEGIQGAGFYGLGLVCGWCMTWCFVKSHNRG